MNVGCMWLFNPQDYIAFHEVHREAAFEEYQNDEQFKTVAKTSCSLAAKKVSEYRERFGSIQAVADFLVQQVKPKEIWSLFFAGVASGIIGDKTQAEYLFRLIAEFEWTYDWEIELRRRAESCYAILHDMEAFRKKINGFVEETRAALRLGPAKELVTE